MDRSEMNDQIPDRRSYDPRVQALIDRVDAVAVMSSKHTQDLADILRRLDRTELKQDNAIKDLSDHDGTLKVVNSFITETKMMHKSFDDFIEAQKETNRLFMEAQTKTSKFQNNILVIGGVAWFMWQMFGSKMFTAAEALIK